MGDRMRWRYGDTNPVIADVDPDTVIEIGDLLWQDQDDAKPASMAATDGDRHVFGLDEIFVRKFLGVAMQRSRAGDASPIRVATTGVFEFDCVPPITCELGDLIGPQISHENPQLANQRVVKVGLASCAIGRAAKRHSTPALCVLVDIRSTVMTGGVD